eukprot:scaffold2954_cov171-Amphora_coffeaeformis.AAC.12
MLVASDKRQIGGYRETSGCCWHGWYYGTLVAILVCQNPPKKPTNEKKGNGANEKRPREDVSVKRTNGDAPSH